MVFEPSLKSSDNRVGGVAAKYNPTRGRTGSGFPDGIMCISSTKSEPGSRRHATPSGSNEGLFPGVQPSAWLSGLCALSGSMPSYPGVESASSSRRDSRVASMRIVAWWTTVRLPGRTSTPRTYRVVDSPIGITKLRKTSVPAASSAKGSGSSRTRSGSPSGHSPGHEGCAGSSDSSPRGAPSVTHRSNRAISSGVTLRSPAKSP